jgi:sortase B
MVKTKIMIKVIKTLDRLTEMVIFVFFLLLLLMGMYGLYDSYLIYQQANDTSLLKYKPGYETEQEEEPGEFADGLVAWLTLNDTGIDSPVMQGVDNMEFLNKDPYGEYSLSGSIFLDCRNRPDFSDGYSLIYGHHMERQRMFGPLENYLEEDYFRSHQQGSLTVGDEEISIRIFAVVEADATERALFAPAEVSLSETIAYIQEHAIYLDQNVKLSGETRLLGLSTCKNSSGLERILVAGVLQ